MTDQNAYINAYVDNSVGMLHEYVTMILQLKTQLKITSDMVAVKDATISSLDEQVQSFKSELEKSRSELHQTVSTSNEQVNESRANASKWEQEYNSIKAKAEHLETFTNQINEMKKMIIDKNNEIETLKNKIEELTKPAPVKTPSPKKVINIEDKREKSIVMKAPETDKNDDF